MKNLQKKEDNNFTISKDITKGIFGNINTKFIKRDKWTSNEIKLYFHLIYHVQKNKKLNITLKPKDFGRNLTRDNHFEYLNELLNNVKSKNFFMKINEDKYRNYSLFSYLEYNNAKDDIVVQFNKDLKDHIFNLTNFSEFDLNRLMELNSYYSLVTRLMLEGVNNEYLFTMSIKNFKLKFQVPESYKLMHIQQKVLDVIKKENEEVIDIYFKKKGRSATHVIIKYDMKRLKSKNLKVVEKDIFSDIILNEISKCKRNIFVSKAWNSKTDQKIKELVKKYGEKITLEILKDMYVNLKQDVSTSLVAYINGILKNKKISGEQKGKNIKPKRIMKEAERVPEEPAKEERTNILIFNEKYDELPELEKEKIDKLAFELFVKETGIEKVLSVHKQIFKPIKNIYVNKIMED